MMIAVWPLVVAIIGALVYALSSNTKVTEMGRITFFVGFFWLVYSLVGHSLKLG
jgi:Na+/phosphate symporter